MSRPRLVAAHVSVTLLVTALALSAPGQAGATVQASAATTTAAAPAPTPTPTNLAQAQIETARHFVQHLTRSSLDTRILADDFRIWTASAGYFNREHYMGNLALARSIWKEPLTFSISNLIQRHNCVVIEASSSGILFTGDHYSNDYLFVIDFDAAGKINHVREYYDVDKIETLYRPAALKWKAENP